MPTKRPAATDAAPPTEPTYAVTIRLQQGTVGGDSVAHWPRMAESRVWALLRDEVAFVRLPAAYENHPGGETKFLNRDQILEIQIYPAWPHDEPW